MNSFDNMAEPETSSSRSKQKRNRIPRPPNAFMIFGRERRKLLAEQNRNLSNKDVSKILGVEWRVMDKESKDRYLKLADEAQRLHKLKHPGYYYSPLEARQRKALRKSKSKMSVFSHQTDPIPTEAHPTSQQILRPQFNGRPFLFPNPMNPMARPVFASPFGSRFNPFIGYPFGSYLMYQNYALYQQKEQHMCQTQVTPKIEDNSPQSVDQLTEGPKSSDDIEDIFSHLPPMDNPNIEITRVSSKEDVSKSQNSLGGDITRMAKAEVVDEYVLPDAESETDGHGLDQNQMSGD